MRAERVLLGCNGHIRLTPRRRPPSPRVDAFGGGLPGGRPLPLAEREASGGQTGGSLHACMRPARGAAPARTAVRHPARGLRRRLARTAVRTARGRGLLARWSPAPHRVLERPLEWGLDEGRDPPHL